MNVLIPTPFRYFNGDFIAIADKYRKYFQKGERYIKEKTEHLFDKKIMEPSNSP